jgi:hypothetical protein
MVSDDAEFLVDHEALRQMMAEDAIASGRLPPRPPDSKADSSGDGASCTVCLLPLSPQALGYQLEFVEPGRRPAVHFVHVPCLAAWETQISGPHDEKARGNGHLNGHDRGRGP